MYVYANQNLACCASISTAVCLFCSLFLACFVLLFFGFTFDGISHRDYTTACFLTGPMGSPLG